MIEATFSILRWAFKDVGSILKIKIFPLRSFLRYRVPFYPIKITF